MCWEEVVIHVLGGGGGPCIGRRWSMYWEEVVHVLGGGGPCIGRWWSMYWEEVVHVLGGGANQCIKSPCILCRGRHCSIRSTQ